MKAIKILVGLLLVLVLVAAIAVFWLANNLGAIVKTVMEDEGSKALGTELRVDHVAISLLGGSATIQGLTIANPSGFSESQLFVLNDISVALDVASLLEQRVDVTQVLIDGGKVVVEQKGPTTNVQQVMKQLQAKQPKASKPAATAEQSTAGAGEAPQVLIRVHDFEFANNSMLFATEAYGKHELSAPAIKLSNIGGEAGVPPEQLAAAFMQPLLKQINQAAKQSLEQLAREKAKQKLLEKEDELKAKADEKLGEGAGEALRSLFR